MKVWRLTLGWPPDTDCYRDVSICSVTAELGCVQWPEQRALQRALSCCQVIPPQKEHSPDPELRRPAQKDSEIKHGSVLTYAHKCNLVFYWQFRGVLYGCSNFWASPLKRLTQHTMKNNTLSHTEVIQKLFFCNSTSESLLLTSVGLFCLVFIITNIFALLRRWQVCSCLFLSINPGRTPHSNAHYRPQNCHSGRTSAIHATHKECPQAS